jgi:hypothetical protein
MEAEIGKILQVNYKKVLCASCIIKVSYKRIKECTSVIKGGELYVFR